MASILCKTVAGDVRFLRELAWAVASGDALAIAVPFGDLPPVSSAPRDVVARKAVTKNGVYYYLVNLSAEDRVASLPERTLTDLSSDETVAGTGLALRPYELRSFLRR